MSRGATEVGLSPPQGELFPATGVRVRSHVEERRQPTPRSSDEEGSELLGRPDLPRLIAVEPRPLRPLRKTGRSQFINLDGITERPPKHRVNMRDYAPTLSASSRRSGDGGSCMVSKSDTICRVIRWFRICSGVIDSASSSAATASSTWRR